MPNIVLCYCTHLQEQSLRDAQRLARGVQLHQLATAGHRQHALQPHSLDRHKVFICQTLKRGRPAGHGDFAGLAAEQASCDDNRPDLRDKKARQVQPWMNNCLKSRRKGNCFKQQRSSGARPEDVLYFHASGQLFAVFFRS